jgi:transposase
MKEREEKYEKRTQKDYSMPFKLSVVREIETTSIGLNAVARKYGIQSETTVKRWLEKYGTFDWENIKGKEMPKTKEQEIMGTSPETVAAGEEELTSGKGAGG